MYLNILGDVAEDAQVSLVFTGLWVLAHLICGYINECKAAGMHFTSRCYSNGSVALFRKGSLHHNVVQHCREGSNKEKSRILIALLAFLHQMMLLGILRPLVFLFRHSSKQIMG